jgi:SAM-dependent methyltransferase
MSIFLQPIRAFEFSSPVYDYIKNRLLWIKPISSIIFANSHFRSLYTKRDINERIVETPFVLANLPKSGKILDVGACESPLSLMLASSGYKVWANDTRPYHFSHPNLKGNVCSILDLKKHNYFDGAICLSTLEHIGINAYGNPKQLGLDKLAIEKIWQLLKPGGKLLLTTPIDKHHHEIQQSRVYVIAELKAYLHSFKSVNIKIGYKNRKQIWMVGSKLPSDFKSFGPKPCAVALISAIK